MTHDDDVIHQADALMRRHRSFIAQAPHDPTASPATSAAEEAEIPLLTEIVTTPDDIDTAAVPSSDTLLDALLDDLHQHIEATLSAWLIDALPAAVANASQHILTELDVKARHALLPQIKALIEQHRPNHH